MEGGSANDYDYCSASPVSCTDTTGTKQRPLTPEEAQQVGTIVLDCLSDKDLYFSSSSFCTGFLAAFAEGDLTAYGFGFTPDKRKKYIHCPQAVAKYSATLGAGDFARAALLAANGEYKKAGQTYLTTSYVSAAETLLLKGAANYVGAGFTFVDALCTNI